MTNRAFILLACLSMFLMFLGPTLFLPAPKSQEAVDAEVSFTNVKFEYCLQPDICAFTVPEDQLRPLFGRKFVIQLGAVISPRLDGECEDEVKNARAVMSYMVRSLMTAEEINIHKIFRSYPTYEFMGMLKVDGIDISDFMTGMGMMVLWTKDQVFNPWCDSTT